MLHLWCGEIWASLDMRWRHEVQGLSWQWCGVALAVGLPHDGAIVVRFPQQGWVNCGWALVVPFDVCLVMVVGTYVKGLLEQPVLSLSGVGWWCEEEGVGPQLGREKNV